MNLRVALFILLALNTLGLCLHLVALRRTHLLRYFDLGMTKSVAALSLAALYLYAELGLLGSPLLDALRLGMVAVYPALMTLLFGRRDRWLLILTSVVSVGGILAVIYPFAAADPVGGIPVDLGRVLNGFAEPGTLGVAYGCYVVAVLSRLMWRKVRWGAHLAPHVVLSARWELLFLANALLRCVAAGAVLLIDPHSSVAALHSTGPWIVASFVLDVAVLLAFGTTRSVYFLSQHGLRLTHPWNAEIERVVNLLEQPECFRNSRYSLNDAGAALGLRNADVSHIIHRDLGITFKQLLFRIRNAHFKMLTKTHPERSKIERLHQSGFQSYASYHLAQKSKQRSR